MAGKELGMGKKAFFLGLAAAVAALSACASQERIVPERDFIVLVIDDGRAVKITEYRGGATSVRIPSRLQNLPVTAIGSSAFAIRKLTSVTIPNTVTYIGNAAFWQNRLSDITIPTSVTHIGASAFGRNWLESVTVPGSVAYVGERAFDDRVIVRTQHGRR